VAHFLLGHHVLMAPTVDPCVTESINGLSPNIEGILLFWWRETRLTCPTQQTTNPSQQPGVVYAKVTSQISVRKDAPVDGLNKENRFKSVG
jgi:hypothetical protein